MEKSLAYWISDVHGLAREKGWWDGSKLTIESILAKLMLIVSELAEAVELVRKPGFDAKAVWYSIDGDRARRPFAEWSKHLNHMPKPEGFGIELADAVIRIFDLLGALNLGPPANFSIVSLPNKSAPEDADLTLARLMRACKHIGLAADIIDEGEATLIRPGDRLMLEDELWNAVAAISELSDAVGVDLEARMMEKHAYNKTRERRHGGKRA